MAFVSGLVLGQWIKRILMVALLVAGWVIGFQQLVGLDVFYAAAQAAASGQLERVYSAELLSPDGPRFFYAPFALSLLKPLGLLSLETSRVAWLALQTLAFFVFWVSMGALYPWLREKKLSLSWVLFYLASVAPIHLNYQSSNIGLMLIATLCLAEVFARSRSETLGILAGVLVALAAVIKVFPLFIVAYYLVARKRSIALGIIFGFALAIVAPVIVFGPSQTWDLHVQFLHAVSSYSATNPILSSKEILSIPSLIQRGLQDSFSLRTLELASSLTGAVIALVFLFFSRKPPATANIQVVPSVSLHNWALALLIMALINPSTRPHYFVFYLPAVASLITWTREGKTSSIGALGSLLLGLSLLVGTAQGVVGPALNDWLEWRNIPTLGVLIIGLALVAKLFLDRNFSQVREPNYR